MQKKHLLKPTPFFIMSILCILYLLFELLAVGGEVEGWAYRMMNLLWPVIVFMLIADFLLKYFIQKIARIILAELILSLGIFYYWIIT